MKLQNQNAIITGGSHGLGKAIVREFLVEGANVLFCARDETALRAAETEFRAGLRPGQKVLGCACDVSSPDDVARIFESADRELGPLHVLVNNAGIYGPIGATEEVPFAEWARAIEINLYGTLLPCRSAIPRLKAAGRGKIVNLSGGGATNPLPRISSYAAAKAAVVRLTETLAEELRAFHIDVNAVAPGTLHTRLLDELLEAGPDRVGRALYDRLVKQAEGGGVPLEKGARLCAYLASPQSDGLTGKLISAQWDPWETLHEHLDEIRDNDIYALRRIIPKDRGRSWG